MVNVTILMILVNLKRVNLEKFVYLALQVICTWKLQSFIVSINFNIIEADGKTHYTRDCHEDSGEACVEEAEENVKKDFNLALNKSLKSTCL